MNVGLVSWYPHCQFQNFQMFLKRGKTIFFKAANAVFGKIGGRASEEVIIQIIRTKCMPVLLYGLEACPLRKSDYYFVRLILIL